MGKAAKTAAKPVARRARSKAQQPKAPESFAEALAEVTRDRQLAEQRQGLLDTPAKTCEARVPFAEFNQSRAARGEPPISSLLGMALQRSRLKFSDRTL